MSYSTELNNINYDHSSDRENEENFNENSDQERQENQGLSHQHLKNTLRNIIKAEEEVRAENKKINEQQQKALEEREKAIADRQQINKEFNQMLTELREDLRISDEMKSDEGFFQNLALAGVKGNLDAEELANFCAIIDSKDVDLNMKEEVMKKLNKSELPLTWARTIKKYLKEAEKENENFFSKSSHYQNPDAKAQNEKFFNQIEEKMNNYFQ